MLEKLRKSMPKFEQKRRQLIDRRKEKKRKKRDRAEGRKIDLTIHDVWHNHRSFHCIERGCVCTHYNRDIMAHQYVHTTGTEATQNVRCLVSINIGSTGCCYCRPSLVYLWRFFFLQRTICLVRGSLSRGGPLICQQTICHCRDLMSPVKTSTTRFFPTRF